MHTLTASYPWKTATKIAFRFCFIYLILYALPFPLGWIPFTGFISNFYNELWRMPVNVTAIHVLGFDSEISVLPNGSGDTTFNYLQILLFSAIAAVGTVVWSVLDPNRSHYEKLLSWLSIYLRYYLAIVMLGYGFVKIVQLQFPFPGITRLMQTYGDSTPMGLLWTFMGYSKAYNIFAGLGEIIGGLLLFFRRTKMLGSLVVMAVMSNVVVLNFAYDVPVKLFSMHLFVIAVFLIVPDLKRLANFFILNVPVSAQKIEPIYNVKTKVAYYVLKSILITAVIVLHIVQVSKPDDRGRATLKPILNGIYEVSTFIVMDDTIPPLPNDTKRWKKMIIDRPAMANIQYMDGGTVMWKFEADTANHSINIASLNSTNPVFFNYQLEGSTLTLKGNLYGGPSVIVLRRRSIDDFVLVNTGFHWIHEYPNNR